MRALNLLGYLFSLSFCFISSQSFEQQLNIFSIEGTQVYVKISDTLKGRVTKIACPTDALYLSDCFGERQVRIINKKYLMIQYEVRGGTGMEIKNTILLVLYKDKFKPCLCIQSYLNTFRPNLKNPSLIDEKDWFRVTIKSINPINNKLKLTIRSVHVSNLKPKENRKVSKLITLDFDSNKFIFYNSSFKISSEFKVSTPHYLQFKLSPQKLNQLVPVIDLGNNYKYYFFNNSWYHWDDENIFFKDYFM